MERGSPLEVNGRRYHRMREPLVVVCVDGCERAYIDEAVRAGVAPWFARTLEQGADFVDVGALAAIDADDDQRLAHPAVASAVHLEERSCLHGRRS